jgi:hypothetical protein
VKTFGELWFTGDMSGFSESHCKNTVWLFAVSAVYLIVAVINSMALSKAFVVCFMPEATAFFLFLVLLMN